MKKLENLKLNNFSEIVVEEQEKIKGGGEWVTGSDGTMFWYVGDVTIIGVDPHKVPEPCPACSAFNDANNNQPSMGVNGENPALSGFGELFFNTIPHLLGWGRHVDTTADTYTYNLAGSN